MKYSTRSTTRKTRRFGNRRCGRGSARNPGGKHRGTIERDDDRRRHFDEEDRKEPGSDEEGQQAGLDPGPRRH